jgi:hypothetical protein
MNVRLAVLLTLVTAGVAEPAASAQTAKRSVAAPACAAGSPAFVRSLQVELAAIGPDCCVLAAAGEIALALDPCDPEAAQIEIVVTDPARGRTERRALPLGDVTPAARPRTLALAVAELVRTVTAAPVAPVASPPPPPPVSPSPASLRATLGAEVELRAYPRRDTELWGGRLIGAAATERWFGAVALTAAAGRETFPLGDVATRFVGVGLSAGPRLARGRVALALGATGELGWGWAAGETPAPGIATGDGAALVASLGARATLAVAVAPNVLPHFELRAAVEGGGVVHGLRAEVAGSPPAGLGGPYVIVGLGFGVGWPL